MNRDHDSKFICETAHNGGYQIECGQILSRRRFIALDKEHAVELFREWLDETEKQRADRSLVSFLRKAMGFEL